MSAAESVAGAPSQMAVLFAFVHSLLNMSALQWQEHQAAVSTPGEN
jgi:hypothetical protein